jgi:hypothetical protein
MALGTNDQSALAASPAPENFESSSSPQTVAPSKPQAPDQDTSRALDSMAAAFNQASLGQPTQTPTPKLPAVEPIIPSPPPAAPGVYSPEQEQAALRAADAIADPERRQRVQQYLKQEYANDAMMDGVVERVRTQNKIIASDLYFKAADQLMNDPHADWATKQTILKKLVSTAQIDPRLMGVAQGVVDHIYEQIGLPNPRKYGRDFFDAQGWVADGKVTTADQVFQMEKPGPNGEPPQLTHEGGRELIQMLKEKETPKANLNAERAEFFKRFAGAIDPGEAGAGGGKTALGQQRLYVADQAARQREQDLIKAGKNPADLYDPNSKEFLGTPENIAKYSVSMQEALAYEAQRITAPPAAGAPPPSGTPAPAPPAPTQTAAPRTLSEFVAAAREGLGGAPAAAPPAAPAQPKAPLGTPGNPFDARTMTRAEIMANFKPGMWVKLPDGRIGSVPYPAAVPTSR